MAAVQPPKTACIFVFSVSAVKGLTMAPALECLLSRTSANDRFWHEAADHRTLGLVRS